MEQWKLISWLILMAMFVGFNIPAKANDGDSKKEKDEVFQDDMDGEDAKPEIRKGNEVKQIPPKILKSIEDTVKGTINEAFKEVHYHVEGEDNGKAVLFVFNQYGTLFKYKVEEGHGEADVKKVEKKPKGNKREKITIEQLPPGVSGAINKLKEVNEIIRSKNLKYSRETRYFATVDEGGKTVNYVFDKNGDVIEREVEGADNDEKFDEDKDLEDEGKQEDDS